MFANLIETLLVHPSMKTNAPTAVQVSLFEEQEGTMLINCLNFQDEVPVIPVHDFWVWVDVQGRKVKSVISVETKIPCEYKEQDDGVYIHLDVLEEFAMLELTFEKL